MPSKFVAIVSALAAAAAPAVHGDPCLSVYCMSIYRHCICTYVSRCALLNMYVFMYMYTYIGTHTCKLRSAVSFFPSIISVYIHLHVYTYTRCMRICVHVHVYMHIHHGARTLFPPLRHSLSPSPPPLACASARCESLLKNKNIPQNQRTFRVWG
jgi:hypothetical protein